MPITALLVSEEDYSCLALMIPCANLDSDLKGQICKVFDRVSYSLSAMIS